MNEVRWIGSFQDANNNQLSQLVFLDDDMPANVRVTNPEVYEDSDLGDDFLIDLQANCVSVEVYEKLEDMLRKYGLPKWYVQPIGNFPQKGEQNFYPNNRVVFRGVIRAVEKVEAAGCSDNVCKVQVKTNCMVFETKIVCQREPKEGWYLAGVAELYGNMEIND